MSAEFMTISMRDEKIDKLNMYRSAMILSEVETDTSKYNQMSGKEMIGSFVEGALSELLIEGNARTIYYVPEDSLKTMGINYAENSRTIIYFQKNKPAIVELLTDVDQVTYPPFDPEAVTQLAGFHWRGNERPTDKNDIFRIVEPSAPPPPQDTERSGILQADGTPEPEEPEEVLLPENIEDAPAEDAPDEIAPTEDAPAEDPEDAPAEVAPAP